MDAAGRQVSELLSENQERIDKARTRLADLIETQNGSDCDDIFLLRYCLSYSDDKKLDEAFKWRCNYYKDAQNREARDLGKAGKWAESKTARYLLKHLVAGFYSTTVRNLSLCYFPVNLVDCISNCLAWTQQIPVSPTSFTFTHTHIHAHLVRM